nr:protein-disulfide reductase DsbD domain-containing protein [Candidatus Acidoferrales bacterium]
MMDARLRIDVDRFSARVAGSIFSPAVATLALAIFLLLSGSATSAQSAHIPHGTLELISENSAITPGHDFTIGLEFKMEHGWHIYWENPGDSGEPPHVTWQLPKGLTAGEIKWPAPRKMGASTIVNYVYDGDVLLMAPIRVGADYSASTPDKIEAAVKFLICSDQMCMPGKAQVSLAAPAKAQGGQDAGTAAIFAAARARLPKPAPPNWKVSGHKEKDSFVIDIQAGQPISQGYFFPLNESQIDNSAPQVAASLPTGLRLTLRKSGELTKPIGILKGVLELPSGEAYLLNVPIKFAGPQ